MLKVALTGGIGSGKSTVSQMLRELGVEIIDTDKISKELTRPHGDAIGKIAEAFGGEFITPDGALDRVAMRQLVFTSPLAKKRLEGILHPMIQDVVQQAFEKNQSRAYTVLDIPLLLETGHWLPQVDRVCIIDCAVETQIARTMQRSQISQDEVQLILDVQATREERLAVADDVIVNDAATSLEELKQRVILQHLLWSKPKTA